MVARRPNWYQTLQREKTPPEPVNVEETDGGEWVLPAIVVVVTLSGISAGVILIRANR